MALSKSADKLSFGNLSESQDDTASLLLIEHFKTLYRSMCAENLEKELLEEVYDQDLLFQDSFHKIQGRDAFSEYCSELYQNLKT